MIYKFVFIVYSFLFILTGQKGFLFSQTNNASLDSGAAVQQIKEGYPAVFHAIEIGIADKEVSNFSGYFNKNVELNLRGGESGYFSNNQAFYILQNYFNIRRISSFQFTTIKNDKNNCYGTGGCTIIKKGKQERVQIYVAVTKIDKRWVIAQFNVY